MREHILRFSISIYYYCHRQHGDCCPNRYETTYSEKRNENYKSQRRYELKDDYYWLRDRNKKKNPEIIEYLERRKRIYRRLYESA